MTIQVSNTLKKLILSGGMNLTILGDAKIQYNRITFNSASGVTTFWLDAEPMFYFKPVGFAPGDEVTISGVTGETKVTVQS